MTAMAKKRGHPRRDMATILAAPENDLRFYISHVHKMSVCVLESSGPRGTPDQRYCVSARPTPTSRSSSPRANPMPANESAEHVPALAAAYPRHDLRPHGHAFSTQRRRRRLRRRCRTARAKSSCRDSWSAASHVVDLGADFRLKDADGLRDLVRRRARGARRCSRVGLRTRRTTPQGTGRRHVDRGAGLLPDRDALALGPFLDAGLIERRGIVVNALSGASGAGRGSERALALLATLRRTPKPTDSSTHRHTPEIEQELGAELLFTPHLVADEPRDAGHGLRRAPRDSFTTTERPSSCLRATYRDDPFVVVSDEAARP